MRVVILDYQGTLTTLPDPVGFVKALNAQGDFTVLYSGSGDYEIQAGTPGLLEAVRAKHDKPASLRDIYLKLLEVRLDITSIVLVDDDDFAPKLVRRTRLDCPVSYLPPERMHELLWRHAQSDPQA